MESTLGFGHFLSNLDAVGRLVLGVLLLLSLSSWTVALGKIAQAFRLSRQEKRLRALWNLGSRSGLVTSGGDDPWSRVVARGLSSAELVAGSAPDAALALRSPEEFVATTLGRAVQEEVEALDRGMVLVATASSAAPFVGLFGTVWSIFHALVAIGRTGDGGLDKVAGPVGEALVMTGIGLAVAIPALLLHNALGAWHRGQGFRLEGFAQEVFARLVSGPLHRAESLSAAERSLAPRGSS